MNQWNIFGLYFYYFQVNLMCMDMYLYGIISIIYVEQYSVCVYVVLYCNKLIFP